MIMTRLLMIPVLALVIALPAAGEKAELIWTDGEWVRLPAPAQGTPEGEAAIVRRELDAGRHGKALKAAKRFLKRRTLHPLREYVLSLAGDAQMRRGNYWKAHRQFKRQIGEFPKGKLAERALEREMEIARAYLGGRKRKVGPLRLNAGDDGVEILEDVAAHAPLADRAEVAMMTIGDHYFAKRRWEEAAVQYDSFTKLYPKSSRTDTAHLRAAESFRRTYRGPRYDETPLVEAEQRYLVIKRDHPAAADDAGVANILRQIRSDRACKQFETGRFYARIGRPGAAEYYFKLVAADYADTPWVDPARKELAKGAAAPATPEPTTAPATPVAASKKTEQEPQP